MPGASACLNYTVPRLSCAVPAGLTDIECMLGDKACLQHLASALCCVVLCCACRTDTERMLGDKAQFIRLRIQPAAAVLCSPVLRLLCLQDRH